MKLRTVLLALVAVALAGGCQLVSQAVGSKNNNLLSLAIKQSDGTAIQLYPKFSPSVTEYVASPYSWNSDSLQVIATADDGGARVTVTGNETNLGDGLFPIQIRVTAENGDKRVYTIQFATNNTTATSQVTFTNNSSVDIHDLEYGVVTSQTPWVPVDLGASGVILKGETRTISVCPGVLVFLAQDDHDNPTYTWNSFNAQEGDAAYLKYLAILPHSSGTYEIK